MIHQVTVTSLSRMAESSRDNQTAMMMPVGFAPFGGSGRRSQSVGVGLMGPRLCARTRPECCPNADPDRVDRDAS